jgi:hypothetical protein
MYYTSAEGLLGTEANQIEHSSVHYLSSSCQEVLSSTWQGGYEGDVTGMVWLESGEAQLRIGQRSPGGFPDELCSKA